MNKIAVPITEAVALSGISRSAMYELFKSGQLTPRKRGKRTLILVEDLKAYLASLPPMAA